MRHVARSRVALALGTLLAAALALLRAPNAHAQNAPAIAPIDPAELSALRPLIPLGAVIVARNFSNGPDARSTVYVRVRAPRETVLHVIATPEEYPAFVPALSSTEVISRTARRGAFRFHVSAVLFDVTATATVNAVNDHRIDFAVDHSDVGPAGARWELFPDADDPTGQSTIVALTVWVDPAHATWAVRQLAGDAGFSSLGAGITADTALALAVKRRAENLAGAQLPVRPARAVAPPSEPEPLPVGPWLALTHSTNIVVARLDDQGSLVSVTAAGTALRTPAPMIDRLLAPQQYATPWPFMRDASVMEHTAGSVRFRLRLSAPLAGDRGELLATRASDGLSVRVEGVGGAFAGERSRWDFVPFERGAYILYTAGSQIAHATWTQRTLMGSEPFSVVGAAACWNMMMIRAAFADLPEAFPYQP